MGITGVAVIQRPEGDEVGNIIKPMTWEEITKVVEVRNRLIGSMAVDHILMVDTVHGEQNIGMSDCRWVSGTTVVHQRVHGELSLSIKISEV